MDKYWKNQYGYYDPVLAKVIERENYKERKLEKRLKLLEKTEKGDKTCKVQK